MPHPRTRGERRAKKKRAAPTRPAKQPPTNPPLKLARDVHRQLVRLVLAEHLRLLGARWPDLSPQDALSDLAIGEVSILEHVDEIAETLARTMDAGDEAVAVLWLQRQRALAERDEARDCVAELAATLGRLAPDSVSEHRLERALRIANGGP